MNGGSRYTLFKKYLRSITWSLGMKPKFGNSLKNGEYGEWLGKKYLKRKGFKVRSVNWRSRRDRRNEIDLICMESEILVFVEIRARSVNSFTTGFESLNNRKRKALLNSFKAYLRETSEIPDSYRFDVVEIDLPSQVGKKVEVFHHENIAIFKDSLH
jgi:putative endonuclease